MSCSSSISKKDMNSVFWRDKTCHSPGHADHDTHHDACAERVGAVIYDTSATDVPSPVKSPKPAPSETSELAASESSELASSGSPKLALPVSPTDSAKFEDAMGRMDIKVNRTARPALRRVSNKLPCKKLMVSDNGHDEESGSIEPFPEFNNRALQPDAPFSEYEESGEPSGEAHYKAGAAAQDEPDSVEESADSSPKVPPPAPKPAFASPVRALQEKRSVTFQIPAKFGEWRRSVTTPNTGDEGSRMNYQEAERLAKKVSNASIREGDGENFDAQEHYPPTACVFVANLPERLDDLTLTAEVTREFQKHGTVFVKIRRDNRNMPFAFVQYTADENAKRAIEASRGVMFSGRACRVEMVKANCSFVVYKRSGAATTVEEVHDLMQKYGRLAECHMLERQFVSVYNFFTTPVFIRFAMFDPARDLFTAFRNNRTFIVDAFDEKRQMTESQLAAARNEEYLDNYALMRRSVYVGDIASDATEQDMAAIFESVGGVKKVELVKRPTRNGLIGTFAFVEFARADLPDKAVAKLDGFKYRGRMLRVERRRVPNVDQTPRRIRSAYTTPQTRSLSPTKFTPSDHRTASQGLKSALKTSSAGPVAQESHTANVAPWGMPVPAHPGFMPPQFGTHGTPQFVPHGAPHFGPPGVPQYTTPTVPMGPAGPVWQGGIWPALAWSPYGNGGFLAPGMAPQGGAPGPAPPRFG